MPSFPEIHNVDCLIGRIEVNRNLNAKHLADAPGHIAVTAEIKVQLQGIKNNHQYRIYSPQKRYVIVTIVCPGAKSIRQQHLLGKSQNKKPEPLCHPFPPHALLSHLPKLPQHLIMVDDRAGNQLRKKGHKQSIIQ